jgi:tetratricopeptide (TPR) repeat protein
MKLKTTFLLVIILATFMTKAQTMSPEADAYNWLYDSLLIQGETGVSSGLILGVESPAMGMMFYNRAIEIQPENPLGYQKKGQAYLDYKMLDEASEAFGQCLDLDATNVKCLHGIFSVSAQGTTNYELIEVPAPMMKQVYNSAMAFLKVAPPEMAEEVAYAELLGYAFKLGIDNPDVYKKYCPIILEDRLDSSSVISAEEIIPAVQSTSNNSAVANLCNLVTQYYFNANNVAKTKEFAQKGLATGYAYTTTYYYLGYTY